MTQRRRKLESDWRGAPRGFTGKDHRNGGGYGGEVRRERKGSKGNDCQHQGVAVTATPAPVAYKWPTRWLVCRFNRFPLVTFL